MEGRKEVYYTAVARQRSGVRLGQAMTDVEEWEPLHITTQVILVRVLGNVGQTLIGKVESG
jgi:hypothetical protein